MFGLSVFRCTAHMVILASNCAPIKSWSFTLISLIYNEGTLRWGSNNRLLLKMKMKKRHSWWTMEAGKVDVTYNPSTKHIFRNVLLNGFLITLSSTCFALERLMFKTMSWAGKWTTHSIGNVKLCNQRLHNALTLNIAETPMCKIVSNQIYKKNTT